MVNEEFYAKCAAAMMMLDFAVEVARDHNQEGIDLITLDRILGMVEDEELE